MRIAGERELEHVQQVDALLVILAGVAVERADVEEQFQLDAEQQREVREPEEEAGGAGEAAFDRSRTAVVLDLFR